MSLATTNTYGTRASIYGDITACTNFQIANFDIINNYGCKYTSLQTECVAEFYAKANVINATTTDITYAWTVSTGGAIIGATDAEVIQVYVTSGELDFEVTLTCVATEVYTGNTHRYSMPVSTRHELECKGSIDDFTADTQANIHHVKIHWTPICDADYNELYFRDVLLKTNASPDEIYPYYGAGDYKIIAYKNGIIIESNIASVDYMLYDFYYPAFGVYYHPLLGSVIDDEGDQTFSAKAVLAGSKHISLTASQYIDFQVPADSSLSYYNPVTNSYVPTPINIPESGHNVALGADGYVDVPINATLGVLTIDKNSFVGNGTADYINNVITILTGNGYGYAGAIGTVIEAGVNTVTVEVSGLLAGNDWALKNETTGVFIIGTGFGSGVTDLSVTTTFNAVGGDELRLYIYNTTLGDTLTVVNVSVNLVQSVQGQVTYYDFTQKKHIGIGGNGTELMPNGDFGDGTTTGWESIAGAIISNENSMMRIDVGANNYSAVQYAINTDINARYQYETEFIRGTNTGDYRHRAGSSWAGTDLLNLTVNDGLSIATFTALSATTYLNNVVADLGGSGTHAYMDNVSLIKLLPLSTNYRLENLTFNNLIVLWDRNFTQADRDIMDANPELIVSWALGNDVGFSIGVIGANDKVYVCSEEGNQELLLEVSQYSEVVDTGAVSLVSGGFVDNADGTFTYTAQVGGSDLRWDTSTALPNTIGYLSYSSTQANDLGVHYIYSSSPAYNNLGQVIRTKSGKNILFTTDTPNNIGKIIRFTDGIDSIVSNVKWVQITSGYLTIQGTYTRNLVDPDGVQSELLNLNDAGVPTSLKTIVSHIQSESFSQFLVLNTPLTQVQLDYVTANPDAIMDIWTGRKPHIDLGLAKADFLAYYPANDYESGAVVQDTVAPPLSAQIQNYDASCRDTYKNINFGASDFFVEKDASGLITGNYPDVGQLVGANDGRYIDIGGVQFPVTDCIEAVYDADGSGTPVAEGCHVHPV